jgi:hypothetical protein
MKIYSLQGFEQVSTSDKIETGLSNTYKNQRK